MNLNLRRCTEADLETLITISKETFANTFKEGNKTEDLEDYITRAFDRSKILSEIKNINSRFYFVYDDGVLVGYFKLNEKGAQTDINDAASIEVERIYVVNTHQGKSIGTWMMHSIIELAKNERKNYIWLGVWEHNTKAIEFYEKHGFVKFGTHSFIIGTDKQTDWLLRLDF
ncbi:GNAT family N-acetyltransferase [Flagellimonas sp. HMM57]|uniref:GNAT family N-acetyltransferase n=1 Tax=unclassified Flagellimonas TaxID=2644544 RepID=UPI0013D46397|nr:MULTISPECIES: GNAT family N-acetyltransferase [unclassified Flagellimonas]UII77527.1 GNAT family N-acetyltransferase [Flagellimonas sp. HMM57]